MSNEWYKQFKSRHNLRVSAVKFAIKSLKQYVIKFNDDLSKFVSLFRRKQNQQYITPHNVLNPSVTNAAFS
jgi:hypothetical protein